MVIDHLAKPPIASGDYDAWKADMRVAAEHPNVYAKVSGLNTAADWETWTGTDLVESMGFALEAFGADRLMFGSDWPVAILAGDYAKVWRETNRALDELGIAGAERAAILGDNAAALYGIASWGDTGHGARSRPLPLSLDGPGRGPDGPGRHACFLSSLH